SVDAAPSGAHQRDLHTLRFQNLHHAVHRVTLSDTAGVEIHIWPVEPHCAGGMIEQYVAIARTRQSIRNLARLGKRTFATVKAPNFHQRPHRDIEYSAALLAVLQTVRDQLEQLRRKRHRPYS